MAYTTIANWLAYARARGDTAPANATPEDQEAALQRAQDYVRMFYVARFAPGVDLADASVAAALAEATHLAAGVELASPQAFTTTFTPGDQKMLVQVGDLKWVGTKAQDGPGQDTAASRATLRHSGIEALLAPYGAAGGRIGALIL